MPDAAILTAAELAVLRASHVRNWDDLDKAVLFDHIDALRTAVRYAHAEKLRRLHGHLAPPCACVFCEDA